MHTRLWVCSPAHFVTLRDCCARSAGATVVAPAPSLPLGRVVDTCVKRVRPCKRDTGRRDGGRTPPDATPLLSETIPSQTSARMDNQPRLQHSKIGSDTLRLDQVRSHHARPNRHACRA